MFEALNFTWLRPFKIVMQSENSECGLACMTMLANRFGDSRSLEELRSLDNSAGNGSNLKQLMTLAECLNIQSRALKLDLDHITDLKLPAIIHWDFNHFVVLTKVSASYVEIADPAHGLRKLSLSEFSNHFTGVALECEPNQNFTKQKGSEGLKLKHFLSNIQGLKRHLALIFGLSLVLQGVLLASPFYMQSVIDLVVVDNDLTLLKVLALGFSLLLIFELCANHLRQKISLHFASRLKLSMSQQVFSHLLHLPAMFFQKRHMGDIVSRFGSLGEIRNLITSSLVSALVDGLMAIITLIVMSFYSIKLTAVVILIVLVYAIIRFLCFTPLQRLSRESISTYADENAYFMQSVRAINTLKLAAKEQQSTQRWTNKLTQALNKDIRIAMWNINLATFNKALFGIENLVVVFIAANLVLDNLMTVGMLFAFMSYKGRFVSAADGLINMLIELKMLDVHLSRLSDIVLTQPELQMSDTQHQRSQVEIHAQAVPSAEGTSAAPLLCVENLSFSFDKTETKILDKLNLRVELNSHVAIVGASGSGKSTLLLCLLGLIQADSGSIKFRGIELQASNRQAHNIAAVLQSDQLLNGSILENISDFDSKLDINLAVQCAQLACLHDDIMTMAMQYQSLIGDMGDMLSGGQRQRLILARALYKRPSILMLDEASSHLDPSTEKQINHNLKQLHITKIVIAHRDESIRQAKQIMMLHKGQLTDVTHDYFNNKFIQQG